MKRSTGAGFLGLFLSGVTPTIAGDPVGEAAEGPAVVVRLGNYAGVPGNRLGKVVELARSVLGLAGVATVWRDCTATAEGKPRGCGEGGDADELTLEIFGRGETRALAGSGDALGVALVPVGGRRGSYAIVYLEQAEILARQAGVPVPYVLGPAMAHEIGHLLLGSHDHAVAGLMRAEWSGRELKDATWGRLRFSEEESLRLRDAVANRHVAADPLAFLTAIGGGSR